MQEAKNMIKCFFRAGSAALMNTKNLSEDLVFYNHYYLAYNGSR